MTSSPANNSLDIPPDLVEPLRSAQHMTVLTGAGISAESGVPTFRQTQTGLWAQYESTQLATPQAFQRNPRLVWEWYEWRRELAAQTEALDREDPEWRLNGRRGVIHAVL